MSRKAWPVDERETVDIDKLLDPVRRAFRTFAPKFNWRKATEQREHVWDGYPISKEVEGITVCEPEYYLSREGLDRALSNDRDVLDNLIFIAFHMGFEQGRRYHSNKIGPFRDTLNELKAIK